MPSRAMFGSLPKQWILGHSPQALRAWIDPTLDTLLLIKSLHWMQLTLPELGWKEPLGQRVPGEG